VQATRRELEERRRLLEVQKKVEPHELSEGHGDQ
jgi:hypothetical protein